MLEILRYYKQTNGLTSKQLAKLVGCSPATMSKIERGRQKAGAGVLYNIYCLVLPRFKSCYDEVAANAELYFMEKK